MSSDPQAARSPASPPAAADWPSLDPLERRLLGVLVEKAKTTPDTYPLTVNSLVSGSNQKSNRDPVMNLSDEDVEEGLARLQKKGLVIKVTGSRVDRWRHTLYDTWHVDKVELAVLAELLLRSPQTEGELRGRASRMEPIDDLERLRAVLKPLTERRLVVYLTEPGRRGTVLTHGFHPKDELDRLRERAGRDSGEAEPAAAAPVPVRAPAVAESVVSELRAELGEVRAKVTELEATLRDLADQLARLKQQLGA